MLSSGVRKMDTRLEIVALATSIFFLWAAALLKRFQLRELMNMDDLRKLRSRLFCDERFSWRMLTWDLLLANMSSLHKMASFDVEDVAVTVEDVARTSRGLKLITVPIVSLSNPNYSSSNGAIVSAAISQPDSKWLCKIALGLPMNCSQRISPTFKLIRSNQTLGINNRFSDSLL